MVLLLNYVYSDSFFEFLSDCYFEFLPLWFFDIVLFRYCAFFHCVFSTVASSCILIFFLFDFLLIRLSLYVTFLCLINDVDFLLLISFLCGFLVLSSLIGSLCEFLCRIPLIWFLSLWLFLLWFFFLWSSLSDSTDWPSFFWVCEFFESLFLKLLKNSIENF